MRIWTIGHSTHDIVTFVDMLKVHDIRLLGDVRSLPGSRRYPQFNAENLAPALRMTGIDYQHFKLLGGLRKGRADSPNTVWRNPSFRAYADYMETASFREGIDQLLAVAGAQNVAIMCSEAVWWRCHRSMISDHLKALGYEVVHIMSEKVKQDIDHPYTGAARIVDGQLVYGAAEEAA